MVPQGRIQDIKLGGAHLKKLCRAEGDAKHFGVFRVKKHDFTPINYFLRFNRGVVHIVVAAYFVDHYCLRLDRGVVHIVVAAYFVDHYCLIFDRGLVHIVVARYILDQ